MSPSASSGPGRSSRPVARRPDADATARRARGGCSTGCSRLDDAALADVSAIVARVASCPPDRRRCDDGRRPPRRPLLVATAGHDAARRPGRPPRTRWAPTAWSMRCAAQRLTARPAIVVDFGHGDDLRLRRRRRRIRRRRDRARACELGLEALAPRTAKLPRIELRAPDAGHRPRHGRRPSRPARSSATRRSRPGCSSRIRRELADRATSRRARGQGDPDRRPLGRALGRGARGDRRDRPGPDAARASRSSTPRSLGRRAAGARAAVTRRPRGRPSRAG